LREKLECRPKADGTEPPHNPQGKERAMSLRINDTAPDFTADTTEGPIHFHEWIGDGWAVLFSHPKDFTPICTTELGTMAGLKGEFEKRNAKIIGISVDPVESHNKWKGDIQKATGHAVNYPMIGDPELKVAKLYDMLPAAAGDSSEGRTPADNQTVRSVFLIGPDKKIKLILTYPMSTGRNFQEILRAIDSIQLTARHAVSTPADWKQGDDVVIGGGISDEEALKRFGAFETVLPYLRKTKQPAA
jgi:alkyl hydroperoxide reductase subunit AhpC